MAGVTFLRAWATTSTNGRPTARVVYEASLENGQVRQSGDLVANPALAAEVSRLDFFDPVQRGRVFTTTIGVGSLEEPRGSRPLWRKLEFQVRCFLIYGGDAQFGAEFVRFVLELETSEDGSDVLIERFAVRDSDWNSTHLKGRGLADIRDFQSRHQAQKSEPPLLLRKLGISLLSPAVSWEVRARLEENGFQFTGRLPLRRGEQKLEPFKARLTRELFDRHANAHWMTVFQRAPRHDLGDGSRPQPFFGVEATHWIFEVVIPSADAETTWNDAVASPYLDALKTTRSGSRLSFVPKLEVEPGGPDWRAGFSLVDKKRHLDELEPEHFVFRDGESTHDEGHVSIVARSLEPLGALDRRVSFPHVALHAQSSSAVLHGRLQIRGEEISSERRNHDEGSPSSARAGFCFETAHLRPEPGRPQDYQTARLGALDLTFPAADLPEGSDWSIPEGAEFALIHASFRPLDRDENGDERPGLVRMEQCALELKVESLEAGSQDDVPGEEYVREAEFYQRENAVVPLLLAAGQGVQSAAAGELGRLPEYLYHRRFQREPPLIVPIHASLAGPFRLEVDEKAFEGRSQTIRLQINQSELPPAVSDEFSLIVIDPQPFLVAKVDVEGYGERLAEALTTEIANWTNRADQVGWELSAGSTGFDLILPPQAVGEAMHRRSGAGDVGPDEAGIDFRFSPPARARLQASYYRQRFVEAPWNLRRILGYPGQRDPGAAIRRLRFELLYGVEGHLEYPFLRLAEIGSRLGRFPGAQLPLVRWQSSELQDAAYSFARQQWADLYPTLLSRLAALEPWDDNQPQRLSLTESDRLHFRLRHGREAELRYPIADASPPPNSPVPNDPRGLAGSYAWAFESKNIYDAVWRDPLSSSAELSAPIFSSMGGWGQFTARFDNDRSAIIASVRMGRAESITIERIGYIGCVRNKAKHVIVYRRSVAPSRQFHLQHTPFFGAPLLRKYFEYVEILEENKPFSRTGADADECAPVRSCHFPDGKPPRIPVDSQWGQDHGQLGWRVPLWNPHAEPKEVYKKPRICLWMDSDQPGQMVQQFIDEPEKLQFYTSVDENLNADTEDWPMVEGIDFTAADSNAVRRTSEQQADAATAAAGGNVDEFEQEEEGHYEPGLGAFTFALAPSARAVNVVADRAAEPVGAALRTITLMRGLTRPLPDNAPRAQVIFRGIGDQLSNALRPAVADIAANATPDDLLAKWDEHRNNAVRRLETFANRLDTLHAGLDPERLCNSFQRSLRNQFQYLRGQIRAETESIVRSLVGDAERLFERLEEELGELDQVRDTVLDRTEELHNTLLDPIRFGKKSLSDLVDQGQGIIDEAVRNAQVQIGQVRDRIDQLNNDGELTRERARKEIAALSTRSLEALRTADGLLEKASRRWAGSRLDQLRSLIQRTAGAIQKATDAAIVALNDPTLPDVYRRCTDAIDEAGQALATVSDDARARLDELRAAVNRFAETELESRLNLLFDEVYGFIRNAADWSELQEQARRKLAEIRQEAESVDDVVDRHLESIQEGLDERAGDLCAALMAPLDELKGILDEWFSTDSFKALFDRLTDQVPTGEQARQAIEDFLHDRERDLRQYLDQARNLLPEIPGLPSISADRPLKLLRAFGDTPKVPQLDFRLPRTAFRFAEFDPFGRLVQLPEVNLSRLVGRANELVSGLNPVGLDLPSIKLSDKLIPFKLDQFDLSSVFPNFAGLDLSSLFKGVKLPSSANDRVKVTHGFDEQNRSGWVQVDVDVPFLGKPAPILSLFGVNLTLLRARFAATIRIEAALGEAPRRVFRGSIRGDWDVAVGGYPIAVLANCELKFDDSGRIDFDVTADKVQLRAALKFLSDLLKRFQFSKGLTVSATPAGVRATLDLPLPNVQAGTFGIANLSLGFYFALQAAPEFKLLTGVSVAKPESPFTLTVFILGGAGHFDFQLSYEPRTRQLATSLQIAIYASASLAVSLGPLSGGLYAYVGIRVSYRAMTGQASDLRVTFVLLFAGRVTVLRFVSITLSISLEAEYRSGGGLLGRGRLRLRIKIGPFFTLKIKTGVEYGYGNPARLSFDELDYVEAATRYLSMFYN